MLRLNFRRSFHIATKELFNSSIVMPKNKKAAVVKGKAENLKKNETVKAVSLGNKNEIVVKIHAKPGAKESSITDVSEEVIGVQIAAPPVDGEANKELIRYLAEILQLKKSELTLEKGSRSREKTVLITHSEITVDMVLDKLQSSSKN